MGTAPASPASVPVFPGSVPVSPASVPVSPESVPGAVAYTLLVSAAAAAFGLFPGHADAGFNPVFVPEHYGPRNSQHLLDPYSFVHFGHGLISFYAFGASLGLSSHLSDEGEEMDRSALRVERVDGLVKTILVALVFEIIENSEAIINLFRQNSGTSMDYRGDSWLNVLGDLLSCGLGYWTADALADLGRGISDGGLFAVLPILAFIMLEITLAVFIRDNMSLIVLQLLLPSDRVQAWQESIIPKAPQDGLVEGAHSAGYWNSKFVSKKYSKYNTTLSLFRNVPNQIVLHSS